MHAIGINKTGDFEVIEKIELPVPANAPGNVLVKACTLTSIYAIERGLTELPVCVDPLWWRQLHRYVL